LQEEKGKEEELLEVRLWICQHEEKDHQNSSNCVRIKLRRWLVWLTERNDENIIGYFALISFTRLIRNDLALERINYSVKISRHKARWWAFSK